MRVWDRRIAVEGWEVIVDRGCGIGERVRPRRAGRDRLDFDILASALDIYVSNRKRDQYIYVHIYYNMKERYRHIHNISRAERERERRRRRGSIDQWRSRRYGTFQSRTAPSNNPHMVPGRAGFGCLPG